MPNVEETPVRRGRPPSARSREAALRATVELLAEVGYGRLTTAAVAMRAGVSTATLYRHWESKDALVTDAVSGLVAEIRIPDEGDVRRDLLSLMRDAVRLYTTSVAAPALRGATTEMSNNPALAATIREQVVETRRTALRDVLQRGVARRQLIRGIDYELALDLLGGPLFYRFLITGGPIDEPLAEGVVDVVMARWAAPPDAGDRRRSKQR
ncbi:MAG: TetR/AcrR family transcriptional regulator [Solirubrobacteraceae bacterium]